MDTFIAKTSGERLFKFIYQRLEQEQTWRHLEQVIRPVGNCELYSAYFRQHASLHLCCKLISAGKRRVMPGQAENLELLFPIIEGYPWNALNSSNRLLRLLSAAVRNSDRIINPSTEKAVVRFCREKHPHCYICGLALNFDDEKVPNFYSLDHVWPRSYGGESVEENLLPACRSCNNRKGNAPTWVATDIHSLFLGFEPEAEHLKTIRFEHRLAVFNRAALEHAVENEMSLKEAFVELGPWVDTSLYEADQIADMFNLRTHKE